MKKRDQEVSAVSNEKEITKFLSNVDLFSKLSRHDRKNLHHHFYLRKFKAGEQVFRKNYPNVIFYVLKYGELKVYHEENNTEIRKIKQYEYFGEIGLFKDEKRTASVVAVQDSELLGISKVDLDNFINRYPRAGIKILYKLGEVLSSHIIKMNEKDNMEIKG